MNSESRKIGGWLAHNLRPAVLHLAMTDLQRDLDIPFKELVSWSVTVIGSSAVLGYIPGVTTDVDTCVNWCTVGTDGVEAIVRSTRRSTQSGSSPLRFRVKPEGWLRATRDTPPGVPTWDFSVVPCCLWHPIASGVARASTLVRSFELYRGGKAEKWRAFGVPTKSEYRGIMAQRQYVCDDCDDWLNLLSELAS